MSGAIGLAVSPVESNHLLLATDSGVLSSKNGGRNWTLEAPDMRIGAAFAVAYDADGTRALVAAASGIWMSDGARWRAIRAPAGVAPARALARGAAPGRVYLAGRSGLYVSDDWGSSWADASGGLPGDPVEAVIVEPSHPEFAYAIGGGRLWTSSDRGRRWRPCSPTSLSGRIEAVSVDDSRPGRLWAAASGQLLRSDNRGEGWLLIGRPFPEPRPVVRSVAVVGPVVLLATDRGLYRSTDSGDRWEILTESLPAHLEAGPLVRDPTSPSTVYAGFSLTPYPELWRRAAEGRSALSQLSATEIAGAVAFVVLLLGASLAAVRRLRASSVRLPLGVPSTSTASPASSRGDRL